LYQCIGCGCYWGIDLNNTESSGICPHCLSIWINDRRATKGLDACFGRYFKSDECEDCKAKFFCLEYGIIHNNVLKKID
jgi:hypothetical protein